MHNSKYSIYSPDDIIDEGYKEVANTILKLPTSQENREKIKRYII